MNMYEKISTVVVFAGPRIFPGEEPASAEVEFNKTLQFDAGL
jgi:hypothetical protein